MNEVAEATTGDSDGDETIVLPKLQNRRRRARRRFNLSVVGVVVIIGWMANQILVPDIPKPVLSAKPAPSNPRLAGQWADLPPMQRRFSEDELVAGDNLAALLARAQVDAVEADAALDALRGIFDVRRLDIGQKVRVFREWPASQNPEDGPGRFAGFDFIPEPRVKITVRRTGHMQFETDQQSRPLTERFFLADTLIATSVYDAARGGGMSPNLVVDLIRLFSFSIDFQRDIRDGDQLEVLYTRRFDENNQLAEEGDIAFAALTNRGKRYAYWRVERADGSFGYFDGDGKSVQRLLMRTPVDGARLSSRFGMRRHPILGYTRLHRGLDFAAPRGTPIYAAGDGQIISLGRNGDYGKYIRIRHRNGYETAYAHMNGYARRMKKGVNVKQGQIIGFVGATGLATGPHLHYEVLLNKKPVNPRNLDVPAQNALTADNIDFLRKAQARVTERMTGLATDDNRLRSLPRRNNRAAR